MDEKEQEGAVEGSDARRHLTSEACRIRRGELEGFGGELKVPCEDRWY